jgi:hypothetical protein
MLERTSEYQLVYTARLLSQDVIRNLRGLLLNESLPFVQGWICRTRSCAHNYDVSAYTFNTASPHVNI